MGLKRSQLQNLIIFAGDMMGITIGYFLMTYIRLSFKVHQYWVFDVNIYHRWLIMVFGLALIYILFYPNLDFFKRTLKEKLICNVKTNLLAGTFVATIAYLMKDADDYSRFIYLTTLAFSFFWMLIVHRGYRKYVLKNRKNTSMARKMLIITTADRAEKVVQRVIEEKAWDIWVTGVIITDKNMIGEYVLGIPVVADYRTMYLYATRSVVDEVFIHVPTSEISPMDMIIQNVEDMGIKVNMNIDLFDMNINISKALDKVGGYYAVTFTGKEMSLRMLIAKRVLDILGGLVGLFITGIATLIVGPLIKLESPGPIFFSQKRVGRNGRIFKIYKFRSMYVDAEERKKELMKQNEMNGLMFKMKDDPRITKIGKFIRKTSIDELPQFWNVLKGDMSLVGTRPPTVDEFEQYDGYHKKRLSMTPGLTGVWQVSGRSDITDFEEIVNMDVDYIDNWSLKRDIEILFKTVQVVLSNESGAR